MVVRTQRRNPSDRMLSSFRRRSFRLSGRAWPHEGERSTIEISTGESRVTGCCVCERERSLHCPNGSSAPNDECKINMTALESCSCVFHTRQCCCVAQRRSIIAGVCCISRRQFEGVCCQVETIVSLSPRSYLRFSIFIKSTLCIAISKYGLEVRRPASLIFFSFHLGGEFAARCRVEYQNSGFRFQ